MANKLVKILKQINIIHRGSINLKNIGVSDFYVNLKKAYGYPEALNLISDELYYKIDKNVNCIAAAGYGGISIATLISSKYNLNLILVRDESKKYGKKGLIEGYIPNEKDKIAIIDDVFTTGGSLNKIIDILGPTGAEIVGCYVVVKRGDGELRVPVTDLLNVEELLS